MAEEEMETEEKIALTPITVVEAEAEAYI